MRKSDLKYIYKTIQILQHLLWLRLVGLTVKAARVAHSNTSLTPSPSLAEHSKYLNAPILSATFLPYISFF